MTMVIHLLGKILNYGSFIVVSLMENDLVAESCDRWILDMNYQIIGDYTQLLIPYLVVLEFHSICQHQRCLKENNFWILSSTFPWKMLWNNSHRIVTTHLHDLCLFLVVFCLDGKNRNNIQRNTVNKEENKVRVTNKF